jgi:hypothetical protein
MPGYYLKNSLLLAELLVSAVLPILFLWKGVLDLRRDFLILGVYLQFLLYVYVGPYLSLRGEPSSMASPYVWFGAWAIPLCGAVLIASYLLSLRAWRRDRVAGRVRLDVQPRRFGLLLLVLLAVSGAFWAIAWSHDIIQRRITAGALLTRQFTLRLPEFAVYRLYIESLPFLIAIVVAGLVASRERLSWPVRASAALTLASAYVYLTINSRLSLALALMIVLGVWALFWRGGGRFWPRFTAGCVVCVVLLLYSNATTEKIRYAELSGESPWRAFLPFASIREQQPRPDAGALRRGLSFVSGGFLYVASAEIPISMRLNGLDLIVRMQPALETRGFAWGRAWKIPVALVVLPIVNPSKARAYKSTFDVTAKNYLIRHYTALPDVDHVSCILTDAYGNFGIAGFALVGAFLGSAFGLGIRTLRWPWHGGLAVVALFFLSHLFQFEQEFVTALLLWVKKAPFLVAVLFLNPFRPTPSFPVG